MSTTGFLGLRASDDFATNQVPEHWRQAILLLFPEGNVPLTALTSLQRREFVDSYKFHWWTKNLAAQGGAVSGVYINSDLSTAYVYATHQATIGITGGTVYCKVAESVANHFRVGHQVLLRDASQNDVDVNAKVTSVVKNGASSSIGCKLLEDDDNSATAATYNLSTVDTILIIGNVNPEGAAMPDAITYDPVEYSNLTQIYRTPLEITRTALKTKLRTGDAYAEKKRESLLYHGIEMEKSGLWGVQSSGVGANSKPERTTEGMIPFVRANAATNVSDYALDSGYSGQTWEQGGMQWLNEKLEVIFRYVAENQKSADKLAFVGSGALLGINRLAEVYGNINVKPGQRVFGMKVQEWETPFGSVFLKRHPLFSFESTNRNAMVLFNPEHVYFRPLVESDTQFYPDEQMRKGGPLRIDGIKEEWLTEGGWEFHHPLTFGYLNGIGLDNSV